MIEKKIRKVLAIDDNQTNLALIKVYLQQMSLKALLAADAVAGIDLAINEKPDLILLDVMMPEIDGFEACRRLKDDARTSNIPIIFVSAKDQAHDKVTGLQCGGIDYITKPFDPGEFKTRVGVVLQMIELQERLINQAHTDPLTGLYNRRYFFDLLEREILQAKIKDCPLSLMMLDLDHFKCVNDTFGHLGGDVILKQFTAIMQENLYPLDIAARYGGEEFIVMMPDTSQDKAMQAAKRQLHVIENNSWDVSTEHVKITTSIGITVYNAAVAIDPYDLIKQADVALYAAKRRGRNCVVSWDSVNYDEETAIEETQSVSELQGKVSDLADRLRDQTIGTISAFAKAIAIKDPYMANHAENVQVYSVAIAKEMGVSQEYCNVISTAALLHDLGKLCIPDEVLKKTEEITEEDVKVIQQHPVATAKILNQIGLFEQEAMIIQSHQEKFDGSGYPRGASGRKIPFGSRVLAIAIAFDAITSGRRYKEAKTSQQALDEMAKYNGNQFDPEIFKAFEKTVEKNKDFWPLALQLCETGSI